MILSKRAPIMPQVEDEASVPLKNYARHVEAALLTISAAVFDDLTQGNVRLLGFAAAPTVAEMDLQQPVVRTDSGNERLYIRIAGKRFYVALTEEA